MRFTKMQGLGNNYIFFNLLDDSWKDVDLHQLAVYVSDVRYGIGSDGMILICPSEIADFRMRIFNADGSEGRNCGNGLRCTAKYLFDHGYTESRLFSIETLGGIVHVEVLAEGSHGSAYLNESMILVNMGKPKLHKKALPMIGDPCSMTISEPYRIEDRMFDLTCLSMGNPHAIIFVDDVQKFPLEVYGPRLECCELFPERVNVGIVRVLNEREIEYRVWERGSGLTMACGTGACAAVVAATLNHVLERNQTITVHLPGGDLAIRWDLDGHVWKCGPAAYVCSGELQNRKSFTF